MRVYVLAALVFEHLMPGKGVWGGRGRGRFPLVSGHLSAWREDSCYTQCRVGYASALLLLVQVRAWRGGRGE